MKNFLILIALIIIGTLNLLAQKQNTEDMYEPVQYYPLSFNINFLTGLPKGDFEESYDKIGFGIGLNLFYNIEDTPLYVGTKLGWMLFNYDDYQTPLSVEFPNDYVDITTDYQMYVIDFAVKIMPDWGPIRPYMEFIAGTHNLSTTTTAESVNYNSSYNDIASSTDVSDWTFNYGVGGGLAFNVFRGKVEGNKARFWELLVDLNAEYLLGGEAEYALSKTDMGNEFQLETAKSKTDMLSIKMGMTFRF